MIMNNKMEFFIVKPNLHQIYGKTVTKDLKFDEYTEDKRVHQVMENLVMTTEIENESEYDGIKTTEYSKLVQEIPEGKILIWNENAGYIVPNIPVCTIEHLKEEMNDIQTIYDEVYNGGGNNDTNRNEEESIETN